MYSTEINKDIERRNEAIQWLIRQKNIQFQSAAALYTTTSTSQYGTHPSSSGTKRSDLGSSSCSRSKSDKNVSSSASSRKSEAAVYSSATNRKESVIALPSIIEHNESERHDDEHLMTRSHQSTTEEAVMTGVIESGGEGNDSIPSPQPTPGLDEEGFIHRWVRTLSKTLHRQRE